MSADADCKGDRNMPCEYYKEVQRIMTECQVKEEGMNQRINNHERRLEDGEEKFEQIMEKLNEAGLSMQRFENTLNNGIKASLEQLKRDMASLMDAFGEQKRYADRRVAESDRRLGCVEKELHNIRQAQGDSADGISGWINRAWRQFLDKFSWVVILFFLFYFFQWINTSGVKLLK